MKNFHLQSIMRSWGPTHPGSFQLSRSQYYSVLITFQPCDQKIITVCQDDHPDMFRSVESHDREVCEFAFYRTPEEKDVAEKKFMQVQ